MAAPTNIYVDPSIAANSGTGTIGDPYGDLQYALNTVTRDGTNGDQFNIKAGTYEVLAAALTYTGTYGNPGSTAPLIFRGYTSAANDGGLGQLDFGGGSHLFCAVDAYVRWVDLEFKAATAYFLDVSNTGSFAVNCTFHDTTGTAVNNSETSGTGVYGCTFYDCSYGCDFGNVYASRFYNGTVRDFVIAINFNAHGAAMVEFNTFQLDGSSAAIFAKNYAMIKNNSIYGGGSSGYGIKHEWAIGTHVVNNLIAGFSGVGGKGIVASGGTTERGIFANNSFYDNTTDYDSLDSPFASANESIGSDPFADGSTGDFTPQDVGNVIGGGFPASIGSQTMNLNRGAIQSAAGGAASMLRRSNMRGGY